MPSLVVKRGQKRWVGEVRRAGLSRKSKVFPDESKKSHKAAVLWEAETAEQLQAEATLTAYWNMLDWSTRYLDHAREQFAPKVYREKRNLFKRLLRHPLFGPDVDVATITPEMFLKYVKDQMNPEDPDKSPRTGNAVNVDRKNLSAAWQFGCDILGGFPKHLFNPFKATPKRPEKRSPRYVPPLSDFWKVVDAATAQDKAMLLAFLHTAARRNEIFNLQLFDLDFSGNRIRLWTRKREGGNLEEDWIPMTPDLKTVLESWIAERPLKGASHVFVCLDEEPFCEPYYGKPFRQRRHFMGRICKKTKVRHFGFHAIRHLTASVLWEDGLTLREIQHVLRHKSPSTTERYLRKLGLMKGTRQAMARALNRGGKVIRLEEQKNTPEKVHSQG